MIVDGILNLLYLILEPLFGLLPDGTFPAEAPSSSSGAVVWVAKLDYLFPFVAPLRFLLSVMATSALAFLAFRIGVFLYNKIRGS